MFTAGLLQKYKFELEQGAQPPCLDPMRAAVLRSHTSKVLITERIPN